MEKLRIVDLFAGIGGVSLGLHRTGGFETIKFCEIKPHAQQVLAKNFPGIPCHGDVTTYDFKQGEADVVTAGFPCQDVSFAGAGAGLAGARSGLYREVIRALRVVRPLYAILENVAALLSRGLDVVLGDLAEIGYDAEWHCIPASAVGAPHRRDRIWIIADAGGEQHESNRAPFSGPLAAQLHEAMADAESDGWPVGGTGDKGCHHNSPSTVAIRPELGRDRAGIGAPDMANAAGLGRQQGNTDGGRCCEGSGEEQRPGPSRRGWWAVEPDVGRVAHGVPMRVDRLTELGNAVVPQIPEIIGRAILQARAA